MARRSDREQWLMGDGSAFRTSGAILSGARPTPPDLIPLMLDAAEWQMLATGLEQRARLFNALLADLYGARRMLRDNHLPTALALSNPNYLRPCVGLRPQRDTFLHLMATELSRAKDGSWMVKTDRADTPAGLGAVSDNRQIAARALPEAFRLIRVRRVTPFLRTLRDTLFSLAPPVVAMPRLILLTPGPRHSGYSEHAALARHLGCVLAESEDLTCRGSQVFMKTLEGLQPVHVILRYMAGPLCDPLDLNGRSPLGFPGLTRAARTGSVAIANILGSGILEAPALLAYLPALCRQLIGEEPRLRSVETWWCGDDRQREHVLANLERLVVRHAFDPKVAPVYGDSLSKTKRDMLANAIRATPYAFVGQSPVNASTAPSWTGECLESRPITLRAFVAANDSGYTVLPGGIAGTMDPEQYAHKDVWILSDAPPGPSPARNTKAQPSVTRSGRDLPSRVADNLFWLGRYLERCEDLTRVLRTVCSLVAEATDGRGMVGNVSTLLARLPLPYSQTTDLSLPDVVRSLTALHSNSRHPTSLRANADRLLNAAGRLRDRLSLDTWRCLQHLHTEIVGLGPSGRSDAGDLIIPLDGLILTLAAANGLVMENMTRGLGWRLLDTGRRIERALHVINLLTGLSVAVDDADMSENLDTLLAVSDSGMTYRARYMAPPQLPAVLDLLLFDESNPRALAYQLALLEDHVGKMASLRSPSEPRLELTIVQSMGGSLRSAEIDDLATAGPQGGYDHLATLLDHLRTRLWELSETLTLEYFAHANRGIPRNRGKTS
jgi:uncharacterized circularly permuted ATP-grasp superfamily protein/uncharacterized alpha-E superfamily protein